MAYFGDATSHTALLGVALALATDLPVIAGVLIIALAMAVIVSGLSERYLSTDTLLGVLAHASLALGLVAVSMVPGQRMDLSAYLFGDILAVTRAGVLIIWSGAVLVALLLLIRWQALLTSTLNPDLATASGGNPKREQLILTLALAITVAVALKVVGTLLIAAMLIIHAATRPFARTPEAMAMGALSVYAGLFASFRFETPTDPSIVNAAALLFALSTGLAPVLGQRQVNTGTLRIFG